MSEYKNIAVLESMAEARVLESMLREAGVPHAIVSHGDSAYDGVFQGPRGWGRVEAPVDREAEILALLGSLRAGQDEAAPGTEDGGNRAG